MKDNQYSNLSAENETSKLAQIQPNEAPIVPDETPIGEVYADGFENDEITGWPGDGSGMDDLADYNANEAMDYYGE